MHGAIFSDISAGMLRLEPRVERRRRARDGRDVTPELEPAFVTWEPPIYLLEVAQSRRRTIRRVVRALILASSFGAAWLIGLLIGTL